MSKPVIVVLSVIGTLVVCVFALALWGLMLFSGEVCDHLGQARAITDRLGAVRSCKANYVASGDVEDADTFVFDLEGERGEGRAWVNSTSDGPNGAEVFHGVVLETGGRRIVVEGVDPTGPAAPAAPAAN